MTYPRNGKTVKIPVQRVKPQLPATDERSWPLLAGPAYRQEQTEARPAIEDADWESRLQAELESWKAQALDLQAYVKELEARAANLQQEVQDCRAQLSDLQTETEDWKAQALGLQAQRDAVRRRSERQAELHIQQERQRVLMRLLETADNLERALAHSEGGDALHMGVQLTLDDLMQQLAQEGVEPIKALGQAFDPNVHEAVATDGSGGDAVVKVLQTGYRLNGELLRPARVVVGRFRA